MRITLFILFLFLLDYYFYKATSIRMFVRGNVISIIYWVFSFFVYIIMIYVFLNYEKKTPSVHFNNNVIFSSIIFISFISKLIGVMPLLLDDVFRLFKITFNFLVNESIFDNSRLDFLKKSALVLSGFLASLLFFGVMRGRYNFKKFFKNIKIKNWPNSLENYKIIHISDLHLGSFNSVKKMEKVVEIINKENADLVFFTGDLVNNYYSEAIPYVDVLRKIKSKHGKFSILGNHDYCDYVMLKRSSEEWKENFKNMIQIQKDIGFDLLLNEHRCINTKKGRFNIVGVENWGKGRFNKDGDLDRSILHIDKSIPTILLSHDPSHWEAQIIKHSHFFDLTLSGHTHGMQFGIEIAGIKWSPVKWRYKQWAGLYQKNTHQIYVNRGIGCLGYAGRVGIMPDISVLKILSQ